MARYLVSLAPAAPAVDPGLKTRLEQAAKARASNPVTFAGARIYDGACAVCHEPGQGLDMFGVKPSLALNSAIRAEKPDTVVRVILDGAHPEGLSELGAMPAFRHHLDDAQVADLLTYLRARFAPDKPAWTRLREASARLRTETLTADSDGILH
jgi:nicotinate dehydrogenase subunit B